MIQRGCHRLGEVEAAEDVLQGLRGPLYYVQVQDVGVLVGDHQPQPVVLVLQAGELPRGGGGGDEYGIIGEGGGEAVRFIVAIDQDQLGAASRLPTQVGGESRMHLLCDLGRTGRQGLFSLMIVDGKMGGLEGAPTQ